MIEKLTFIVLLTGLILLLTYIDKKYQLGLVATIDESNSNERQLGKQNKELKERIEVLERIVTEPKYELNRAIQKLEN